MRQIVAFALPVVAAWLSIAAGSASGEGQKVRKGLRPAVDASFVKAFQFNQRLLICNAYPSTSRMLIKKNSKSMLSEDSSGLAFKECRYMVNHVQKHDKLDVEVKDIEIHGTFEVGELPTTDAVLLLVLSKQGITPLISFQSFAFPTSIDSQDAQLAIIDTYRGNSTAARLKMEDHVTGKEEQTVSKRVEQLNFNRVYAVEEGDYDASVSDHVGDLPAEEELSKKTKKVFKLEKNHNYVILRTGDAATFEQTLVVFPEMHGGSSALSLAGWCTAAVLLVTALSLSAS